MKSKCIDAVEAAIGRPLRAGEAAKIEGEIIAAKRSIATADRTKWLGMTESERLIGAAEYVAASKKADIARKQQILALNILAMTRLEADLTAMNVPILNGINKLLSFDFTGTAGMQSVGSKINDITVIYNSKMADLIEATKGKWVGFVTDHAMIRDIANELHGTDTGNAIASKAAQSFRESADALRERFNRGGGEVGKLEDWAMPHTHSMVKIAQVSAETWVSFIRPLLNRERYVREDGSLMSDAEVNVFLTEAYKTLKSDGANKMEPGGVKGTGSMANRGSESRSIHFKDGESWVEYQKSFGEQDLTNVLFNHIRSLATNIAFVERFGPSAMVTIETMIQRGVKESMLDGQHSEYSRNMLEAYTRNLLAEVAGLNPTKSQAVAEWSQAYRNSNVSSMLGGTTLVAVTDGATMIQMSREHRLGVLGFMRMFGRQLKMLNPLSAADREVARSLGLGINEFMGQMSRFGNDGLVTSATMSGKTSKFFGAAASATMRLSLLNALTAANKSAFSKMLLDKYGRMSRDKAWADLHPADRKILEGGGITETDWQVWGLSKLLEYGGGKYLSHREIYAIPDADILSVINPNSKLSPEAQAVAALQARERAADVLMGHVLDEQGLAVIEAGARENAVLYGWFSGSGKGTKAGEVARNVLQFKSFTAAIMLRHGSRAGSKQGWSRAAYAIELSALLLFFGALATQINAISNGHDLDDITKADFWKKAVLKGGGLGIFGDVLNAGSTPGGKGLAEVAGGPIYSDLVSISNLTVGNTAKAMREKDTSVGVEALKLTKSHIPMQNLWYTKAATDRLFYEWMVEYAQPGYYQRQAAKQRRLYDRTAWWGHSPEDGIVENLTPDRAPDWEKAIGE